MPEEVNVKTRITRDLNKTIKLYSVEHEVAKEEVISRAIEEGMRVLISKIETKLPF